MSSLTAPSFNAASVAAPAAGEAREVARWVTRGTPAYRRISLALFLAGFSTFSLIYAVQPLLPDLAVEFGVTPSQSSLALSLSTGALALAILLAAALSERVSRRGLMFASMAGAAALHVAAALVPGWHAMLLLRALEGFVLGGVPAVAMAYLAEEIDPRALGSAMGLYVGGTAFGAMMGRLGIGALTEMVSWRTALGTLGLLDFLAALGFLALLPASRNFTPRAGLGFRYHRDAWLRHLGHPGLPLLFLMGFLALGVNVAMFNYLTFRLSAPPYGLGQGAISAVFVVFLFGAVASSAAGNLADRWSRGPVLILGVLTMGAGVMLTLSTALPAIFGGVVAVTIGFFMTHSVASGWVGRMASGAKGHAASLYLLSYYLGSSVVGSAGGWFWSRAGWPGVVGFALTMVLFALLAAIRLLRLNRSEARHRAA